MRLHQRVLQRMERAPQSGVDRAVIKRLDGQLKRPFTIANARLTQVTNYGIGIRFHSGVWGYGECPVLHPVTPETETLARDTLSRAAFDLKAMRALSPLGLQEMAQSQPYSSFPGCMAAVEMAIFDGLARALGEPLHQWFGGQTTSVVTDMTIPICSAEEAFNLALFYKSKGFTTIKTKIGLDIDADIARLKAIQRAHPDVKLILDANEGYTANEALRVIAELKNAGIVPVLFEQPVHRDNWDGLKKVSKESGVLVAADESCRNLDDARRIVGEDIAPVINIKLVKTGVLQALQIIDLAREHGVKLMIGGMVETRLAMGFSAHLAAGSSAFQFIDLDTPLLFTNDPIQGGYSLSKAPKIDLQQILYGHGGYFFANPE